MVTKDHLGYPKYEDIVEHNSPTDCSQLKRTMLCRNARMSIIYDFLESEGMLPDLHSAYPESIDWFDEYGNPK